MSQAPGFSGIPDLGHCSSAATRASCARSSATPTSRTIRVRPAMSLACSILKTASMARWGSVAVTGYRLTHLPLPLPAALDTGCLRFAGLVAQFFARPGDLADLTLTLPSGQVLLVQIHEPGGPFQHLGFRRRVEDGEAADHFLGLREWPVCHGHFAS